MATKNVQVIDGADNCVYDVFSCSDIDFSLIFPDGTDIAFSEELDARQDIELVQEALSRLWGCRVRKSEVQGIHGTLFVQLGHKRKYYPTLRDEDAVNPDGSKLRA